VIFQKENDKLLLSLAVKNNLDMDSVIAGYLIMGEQFLMMMRVFEGRQLQIPSKRRLCSPSLRNIHFIEDDKRKYEDYERDDVIDLGDKEYTVVAEERKVLNHWYIPVVELPGDE
jgi:hypothetical protein